MHICILYMHICIFCMKLRVYIYNYTYINYIYINTKSKIHTLKCQKMETWSQCKSVEKSLGCQNENLKSIHTECSVIWGWLILSSWGTIKYCQESLLRTAWGVSKAGTRTSPWEVHYEIIRLKWNQMFMLSLHVGFIQNNVLVHLSFSTTVWTPLSDYSFCYYRRF
jgi:hypothetical protein